MTNPDVTVRVDWDNDGAFTGGYDDVTSTIGADSLSWTRGRSADFSAEAVGAASFTLVNTDGRYSPDRNWCDNGSFEKDTVGWGAPVRGMSGATIARVADTGAGAGAYAGEVSDSIAGAFVGVGYTINYPFRAGTTYAISFMLKRVSGDSFLLWGVAANDDVDDYMEDADSNFPTSWTRKTIYWTPYADRTRAGIYLLHVNASVAVWRVDGVQVNPLTSYPGAVLATAPIAYWMLDETTGSAHDVAGGHTGSYVNSPSLGQNRLVQVGRSIVFDGGDAVVTVGSGPVISGYTDWTLAAWIRPTSVAAGWHAVFGCDIAGGVGFGLNGAALYVTCINTADAPAATGFTAAINTTYFITATYVDETATLSYYVNGAFVSSHTFDPTWEIAGQHLIGVRTYSDGGFIGTVDDPAIWDRALSAAEIAALRAAGLATPTPNTYIEAPTKGQLVPGRPVHISATHGNTGNLSYNGSFELGTGGWDIAGIAPYCGPSTSVTQVTDNAPGQLGSKAGSVVFTSTYESGIAHRIYGTFHQGVTYSCGVWLKSVSGNVNFTLGLVDPAGDAGAWGGTITTSWAYYPFTFTPTADRTNVYFMLRTQTAATATVRIDALTASGPIAYPQFFGYVERLSPDAWGQTVEVTCYDPLKRMAETDVAVGAGLVKRTARDFRIAILEDMERGDRNLLCNPHMVTNLDYWTNPGSPPTGGLSRITTDHCPETTGNTCLQAVAPSIYHTFYTPLWNVPQTIAGVTYRASVWLKWVSGYNWVKIGLGGSPNVGSPVGTFKDVYIDGTWRKYSITFTPSATKGACEGIDSILQQFGLSFSSLAAGTYLVDGAMVTRGQAAVPYTATGTGRSPNYCANGSFDGDMINGWSDGWANLVTNPSFETNTTGWTGGTITRITSDAAYGSACATIDGNSATVTYNITGTFKAGVTYDFICWFKLGTSTGSSIGCALRSSGTPTDYGGGGMVTVQSYWQYMTATWTPSADRTDGQLFVFTSGDTGTVKIDAFRVNRRSGSAAPYEYSDTGPGTIGSHSGLAGNWNDAKYGSMAHYFYTEAMTGSGRIYDFNHNKPVFLKGVTYTLSMWIKPPSSMPYRMGIAAMTGLGGWDEGFTTGTLTANVWTQVTCTWTPAADRQANGPFRVCAYIYQTDSTARSFPLIDGVRVNIGSTADAFEMPQWDLGDEDDIYRTEAALSGTALSCLNTINSLAMSRHWIEPTMTSPWFAYTTVGRSAVKESVESFNNDMQDMTDAEIDRASIINVVPISYSGGSEYYSDPTSVATFGPRPGATINGTDFFDGTTYPDAVGAAMLTRFEMPRARPTMVIKNRFPTQLWLGLDDLISVSNSRLRVAGSKYTIASITTSVTAGGALWTTSYRLEERE